MTCALLDGLWPAIESGEIDSIEFALEYVEVEVARGHLHGAEEAYVEAFVVGIGQCAAAARSQFQTVKIACEVGGAGGIGGVGTLLANVLDVNSVGLAFGFAGAFITLAGLAAVALFGRRNAEAGLLILPRLAKLREAGLAVIAERATLRREGDKS